MIPDQPETRALTEADRQAIVGANSLRKFDGLIVSDYAPFEAGVMPENEVKGNRAESEKLYINAITKSICSGMDMYMIGHWDAYFINRGYNDVTNDAEKGVKVKDVFDQFKLLATKKCSDVGLSNVDMSKRIQNAVVHILRVKLAMGLISNDGAWSNMQQPTSLGRQISIDDKIAHATTAVSESLVLLKNNKQDLTKVIPISAAAGTNIVLLGSKETFEQVKNKDGTLKTNPDGSPVLDYNIPIVVPATTYDNVGLQTGGWALTWQGQEDNTGWPAQTVGGRHTHGPTQQATTIKDALMNQFPNATFIENADSDSSLTKDNTIAIAVIAEKPHAEYVGDQTARASKSALLPMEFDTATAQRIADLHSKHIPVISIILSGRPRLIDEIYTNSDAVIAAWLPGTSAGKGIVDALVGTYKTPAKMNANKLPFVWPTQLPITEDNFPSAQRESLDITSTAVDGVHVIRGGLRFQ